MIIKEAAWSYSHITDEELESAEFQKNMFDLIFIDFPHDDNFK